MAARGGHEGRRDEPGGRPRTAEANLLDAVGRDLASVYEELLGQPMPPRIADLVARIGGEDGARRIARAGEA